MSDKPKKLSNLLDVTEKEQLKQYITAIDNDVFNITQYLDKFPRMFTQSTEPTIQRNTFAFWKDSDDSKFYLLLNVAGTTKKVELT